MNGALGPACGACRLRPRIPGSGPPAGGAGHRLGWMTPKGWKMGVLTTSRCILRKPQEEDRDGLWEIHTDPDVRRYLGGPVAEAALEKRIADRLSADGDLYWVIRHASSGAFIGCISLDLHHDGVSTEVSYQLLPRWWGQGYGAEVVQEIIRYAFEELGLPKVLAETQTANQASCRLLRKIGMRLEQTAMRFGAEQSIYSITNRGKGSA